MILIYDRGKSGGGVKMKKGLRGICKQEYEYFNQRKTSFDTKTLKQEMTWQKGK